MHKPVLDGFDLTMPPDELRRYASEADVYCELFVARCRERGVTVAFGGNPMGGGASRHPASAPSAVRGDAQIFLETASTHTGTNVEYSRATLSAIGVDPAAATLVVVQQPALQLRTCLTWQRQTGGVRPLGWTPRPTEEALSRPFAEMVRYAVGELQRIPAYAAPDKAFCAAPDDFPHELVASVEALNAQLNAA